MRSIRDRPQHPLEYTLGQLRHCYALLVNGENFNDRGIAEGFISPAIKEIQKVVDEYKAQER